MSPQSVRTVAVLATAVAGAAARQVEGSPSHSVHADPCSRRVSSEISALRARSRLSRPAGPRLPPEASRHRPSRSAAYATGLGRRGSRVKNAQPSGTSARATDRPGGAGIAATGSTARVR